MQYSKRLFLPLLFSIVTGVGAYWTYYGYTQIYDYCFSGSILYLWEPINCNNILDNIFASVWGWWILTTIIGAIGLTSTSYWIWEQQKNSNREVSAEIEHQKKSTEITR